MTIINYTNDNYKYPKLSTVDSALFNYEYLLKETKETSQQLTQHYLTMNIF